MKCSPVRLAVLLSALLWLWISPTLPAGAQDPAFEVALPDSVVITASRYPEDARYASRRVSVWTAADIDRLPVRSVDDLLRTLAGVDVQSRGGFGVQSDFSIRGSGFNGVLLLLDGAPINDPMTGHFLADLPVPLSEIARVEVLRGSASAIYGPDALGGVIQIFTYAGLRRGRTRKEGHMNVGVAGGQHGLYEVDAGASVSTGKTFISAGSAWQGTDGEKIVPGVRTDFRRRVHTAAMSTFMASADVFVRAGWDDRSFSAFHFYTPFPSDTARESTSTFWLQAGLESDSWTAQIHAKQHDDRYIYNPVTPANTHTSRVLGVQALRRWSISETVTLSTGGEAGLRGIESNNLGTHEDASAEAFASAIWSTASSALRASAAAAYDPAYGVEVTPQLFASVGAGRLLFRGGVARAVRAPNYIERYFNTTLARPRGRSLGNPDLRPERGWSAEAGVSASATPLSLHVTAFRRVTRNLIDYAMLSSTDSVFLARNLHRVRVAGLEIEVDARRPVGTADLRWSASYAYTDADLGDVAEQISFKYALTHAKHLAQTTLTTRLGRALAALRLEHKNPMDRRAYTVSHGRIAYVHPAAAGRLTLSLEVRNVFDVSYADVFDAPMPGRWLLVSLRWQN